MKRTVPDRERITTECVSAPPPVNRTRAEKSAVTPWPRLTSRCDSSMLKPGDVGHANARGARPHLVRGRRSLHYADAAERGRGQHSFGRSPPAGVDPGCRSAVAMAPDGTVGDRRIRAPAFRTSSMSGRGGRPGSRRQVRHGTLRPPDSVQVPGRDSDVADAPAPVPTAICPVGSERQELAVLGIATTPARRWCRCAQVVLTDRRRCRPEASPQNRRPASRR